MNFYDVIAAEKWGGGIPTMNFFDLLFAQSISGGQWETYEGTLPATINANGDDMRQYQVWGNTGGVGEPTDNLFEVESNMLSSLNWGENPRLNNIVYFINFKLSDTVTQELKKGIHTCSIFEHFTDGYTPNLLVCALTPNLSNTVTEEYRLLTNSGVTFVRTFDFSDWQDIYLIIGYGNGFNTKAIKQSKINELFDNWEISIVEGSTAPASYEPYGYKLDMVSSDGTTSTTTSIYIGDDPLWAVNTYADCADYQKQKVVRAIKKYVLTGKEDWEEITGAFASRTYFRWVFAPINYCVRHVCTCSHFTQATITTATTTVGFDVFDSTSVNGEVLVIRPANVQTTTLADFKAWLAEQYATGIPVIVWCALTTAEETDPPVPLPALPTCEGTTVIDYEGQSAAPEKVLLEYKGGKQP